VANPRLRRVAVDLAKEFGAMRRLIARVNLLVEEK
jgi:hypothetical protein